MTINSSKNTIPCISHSHQEKAARLPFSVNFILLAFVLTALVFLNGCSKGGASNPTPKATVTITSLSVTQGSFNLLVKIKGSGFGYNPNDDNVLFNGKKASLFTSFDTSIYAYVPLSAGTGPVSVTVNGATAVGPVFTYVPALVVTLFAGSINGFGNMNGTGTAALFNEPEGIAIDKNGNLYVADSFNNVIRKITPQAVVTTFAGTGKQGTTDGTTLTATFEGPTGVAVDQVGNVFVIDGAGLREITADGHVKTIGVGVPLTGLGIAIDGSNNVYVLPNGTNYVFKLAPGGTLTRVNIIGGTGSVFAPYGIAADNSGNLLLTNYGAINKITLPAGSLSLFSGSGFGSQSGITVDKQGNVYIANTLDFCIDKITPDGKVTVIAGVPGENVGQTMEGVANTVPFLFPNDISVDASGSLFVTDGDNIKKISIQ